MNTFSDWVRDKKVSPKQVSILSEVNSAHIVPILKWIGVHQPSHGYGVQILELGAELLLMKQSLPNISKYLDAKTLLDDLKNIQKQGYDLGKTKIQPPKTTFVKEMHAIFDKVYIQSDSVNTAVANRAYDIFDRKKIKIVSADFFKPHALTSKEFTKSKKTLLIKKFKGRFFKRCPGVRPKIMCCNYYVLNLGQYCEMDCSYCYLQSFINFPAVVIYSNIEDALLELKELRQKHKDQYLRVGTGEQTDSLSLDDITYYSKRLVEFFNDCPNWLLEFKTKSSNIKNFINVKHRGNVVVSWSVNPEYIVNTEEHKTSSLKARIQAAKQVLKQGFKVSFHIDPVIYHQDWQVNYSTLIQTICKEFKPTDLHLISLGALRFQPQPKSHHEAEVFYGIAILPR